MTTKHKTERGQALILIALAAIGLFGMAGLAIDGSMKFSDRRHAQNAADTAVLAAALAKARGASETDWKYAAKQRAESNGYDGNFVTNTVNVYSCDETGSDCGYNAGDSEYVKVVIISKVNTTFSRVVGINQTQNTVEAIALANSGYSGPAFSGNSLVSLALSGNGYDAHGTPIWNITGGGIMVNSSSSSAATCGGNAGVSVPAVSVVGGTSFGCHTVNIGSTTTGATQLSYSDYASWLPRQPACNGTATFSGGQWHPQSGADGSKVTWTGDADFASGLYCVTNSPGSFNGAITGTGVTFYMTKSNFSLKLNGGGNITASAPTTGEYAGVLIYLAPQVDSNGYLSLTQALDLRGSGSGNVTGTVIAPSATVTMFGNSGTGVFDSQVIAYNIDTGGTANITVSYNSGNNWYLNLPPQIGLFQ